MLSRLLRFFVPASLFFFLAVTHGYAQQTNQPVSDPDCGGPSYTTVPTNAGTDFLLCFEENIDTDTMFDVKNDYLQIYVASLGDTATVTITTRQHPSFQKTFFLQPHSSFIDTISADSVDIGGNQKEPMHDLWILSSEVPDPTVVEVQSTSPIVCYGMDHRLESADAFCALPHEYAGTDYEVMCYPKSDLGGQPTYAQFAVAAFQDNTNVTVVPTAPTKSGSLAGVPLHFTLQHGQCVQIQTKPDTLDDLLDLTGSHIYANHPIAVYSGHERTQSPFTILQPDASRDILLEAVPPTSTWGKNFVVNPFSLDPNGSIGEFGDVIRVLALDDSTAISINGVPWTIIDSTQHRDTEIMSPTLVQSSGPILVGEIEHSSDYFGVIHGSGDPSLSIVPPIDQSYNSYSFFLPPNPDITSQFVTVATDSESQSRILLDGNPMPSGAFRPVQGSINGQGCSIADYQATPGLHTISAQVPQDRGFTILAYGIGVRVSYGYTAGSLLIPKRAIRIENPPTASHTNILNFHNTAYQPAYLDSALFIPDNPKESVYGIHSLEDVGLAIGRMDIGASAQIHLVADYPLTSPVRGKVKIYSHLPSYFDIEPGEIKFTLYPDVSSSVDENNSAFQAFVSPDPFVQSACIHFSIPANGDITIKIFDELGREIRTLASSEFAAGSHTITLERNGISPGVYTCEITSAKLGIHSHFEIVAGE